MPEHPHPSDNPKKADNGYNNVAPRYLMWVLIGGGIALLGLLLTSIYWPNLTERTKFFTGNLLNLVVSLAVIAQVLIYRNQWQIERARIDQRLRVAEVRAENFEVGKRPIFIVTIANDGLIDATDVRIHMGVEMDTDKELNWIHDPIVTIPASGKEHFFILSSSWLEQPHIDGFNNTVPLKVVGYFDYWPVGRKDFCYRYLPWDGQRPEKIPQFLPCDFEPRLNTTLHLSAGVMALGEVGVVGVVIKKEDLQKLGETQAQDEKKKEADP